MISSRSNKTKQNIIPGLHFKMMQWRCWRKGEGGRSGERGGGEDGMADVASTFRSYNSHVFLALYF